MFTQYDGELNGLTVDENHLVFRWLGEGKILFSVAQRGKAAMCHFSSDKKGLRHVKHAINDWCEFILNQDWCEMILASVEKESVSRVLEKCNFQKLICLAGSTIYGRKKWAA